MPAFQSLKRLGWHDHLSPDNYRDILTAALPFLYINSFSVRGVFFEIDDNDPNLNYDYNVITKVVDNYDRGLPGDGILIWHINEENYNANSSDFVGINNDINNNKYRSR